MTFLPTVPDHTWCRCDNLTFQVREGPDHNRLKKKAPSAAPLYDAFAVDVFWYAVGSSLLLNSLINMNFLQYQNKVRSCG